VTKGRAADSSDAAQAVRWLADARCLLDQLSALPHVRGQAVRSAALDMVPALAQAIELTALAGPATGAAGFSAAAAVHAAAAALVRVVERGSAAEPGDLAHAGWLVGRAHVRAEVKATESPPKRGRPPGSGDVSKPHIEKLLLQQPRPTDSEVVALLYWLDPAPDVSYVGKVRRALDKHGRK
jgi:hypothetical protein